MFCCLLIRFIIAIFWVVVLNDKQPFAGVTHEKIESITPVLVAIHLRRPLQSCVVFFIFFVPPLPPCRIPSKIIQFLPPWGRRIYKTPPLPKK